MTVLRIAELVSGIVTGLLAVVCFFLQGLPSQDELASYILGWVLFWGLPGLLLLTGAYFQSVRKRSWGFVLVIAIAFLSAVFIVVCLFGGIFYWGVWTGLLFLAPSMMAIVTAISGFTVLLSELPK